MTYSHIKVESDGPLASLTFNRPQVLNAFNNETMDECRVSWGRVVADHGDNLLVERPPLALAGDDIVVGPPAPRSVLRRFDGKTLLAEVSAGDVVAVHWGCACYKLTARQQRYLEKFTCDLLALTNRQRRGAALLER